ncbi:DUF805 domain-containing protein [Rothia terrae]|uniref:DUF805 domain-containing protein n=1 Tax=Rothia terrae TaxID=396015 RepID=UPI0033EAB059
MSFANQPPQVLPQAFTPAVPPFYPTLEDHYNRPIFRHSIMRFLIHRFDLRGTASRTQFWEEHTLWIAIFLLVVVGGSAISIWLFTAFTQDASYYDADLEFLADVLLIPASYGVIPVTLYLFFILAWQGCTFGVTMRRVHDTSMPVWLGYLLLVLAPGFGHLIIGCLPRSVARIPDYCVPPNHPLALQSGFNSVNYKLPPGVDPAYVWHPVPELERLRQVSTGFPINGGAEHQHFDTVNGVSHRYTSYTGARTSLKLFCKRLFTFSGRAGLSE